MDSVRTLNSQTWAVPPADTNPPVPLPRGQAHRRPSLTISEAPDYSDSDSEDTFKAKPRAPAQGQHRGVVYKPSFSKPTFQWIRGELVGRGSYGKVYLALNATTGEVMAVKQVELPKTASDRINTQQLEVMKALKFEGDTLRDLDHPHIVSYLGFEESQDYLSIFLEYVSGGTVNNLLQKHGRLREEVTKFWLSQILDGLDYLHSKGILHRDLKADNILVDEQGNCKISDFGISKKAGEINRGKAFTTMKGTVFWMAPEILSNEGVGYDVKVDIWSVGCVAVEMWTGRRPWFGQQMLPVMMQVVKEKMPPPIPSDIPMTELADSFRTLCFHSDPSDRPHAADLLRHPYLQLPDQWAFNSEDLADNLRPPRSHPELLHHASSGTLKPASQKHKTPKPPLPTLKIPVWNKAPVDSSQGQSTAAGPPVVFITPPNTPRVTPRNEEHSATSASDTPDRKFRRRLIICNPDDRPVDPRPTMNPPPPPSSRPSYMYTPPPLPAHNQSLHASPSRFPIGSTSSFSSMAPTSIATSKSVSPSRPRPLPESRPSSARTSRPLPIPQSSPPMRSPALPAIPPPRRPGSASSRDRSHTLASIDTSALRSKYNVPKGPGSSGATTTTPRVRRLPLSPQQSKTSSSSTTSLSSVGAPSSASSRPSLRTLMKQKSVPDVSIFSYDPFAPPRNHRAYAPRGSYDAAFEDYDVGQTSDDGSQSSTGTASAYSSSTGARSSYRGNGNERRESTMTIRPRTQDVYDHLEAWFPHHDLDQPVVASDSDGGGTATLEAPVTPKGGRRQDARKSIRMIAKEQNRLSHSNPAWSRRRTMLWNTHMEELKDNR